MGVFSFQLSFMYFFKVGTHKGASPQLIPATSRGDKSHCVKGLFLIQSLVTGTMFWSQQLVPRIQTGLNFWDKSLRPVPSCKPSRGLVSGTSHSD